MPDCKVCRGARLTATRNGQSMAVDAAGFSGLWVSGVFVAVAVRSASRRIEDKVR